MSFEDIKKLPPLQTVMVAMTKEEFYEYMKPIICEQCRRVFNPTEEEKIQLAQAIEDMKNDSWVWEVISPLK